MNVLIAGEFSGVIRDAFRRRGHNAFSCDLLPCEADPTYHLQGDVRKYLHLAWDLVIAHPDCTYHTNSSVLWFTHIPKNPKPGKFYGSARFEKLKEAVEFFQLFQHLDHVPMVAIENPIPHCYSIKHLGPYSQIVQPWWFGHKEFKATCWWLKGLPLLEPTNRIEPPVDKLERIKWSKVHRASPGPNRSRDRSRFLIGHAEAIADQWGGGGVKVNTAVNTTSFDARTIHTPKPLRSSTSR